MAKDIKNRGASIRAKLLTLAKTSGQSFDLVLTRFAIERLLYRLSVSAHAEKFVLKGAMLLMTWVDEPHRGTRDLDLLGLEALTADGALAVFQDILGQQQADGIEFGATSLRVDRIREQLANGGFRLITTATIDGAKIKVAIDIGFGDSLTPGAEMIFYPAMLDYPGPMVRAYAPETVVAEKFEAMVALGLTNSRMKDFHDILVLSRTFPFSDDRLPRAIAATFARRGTAIPMTLPDALTPAFSENAGKLGQWKAFVRDVAIDPGPLSSVISELTTFLMPQAKAAALIKTTTQ